MQGRAEWINPGAHTHAKWRTPAQMHFF